MNPRILLGCIAFIMSSFILMIVELNILELNEPFWFLAIINSLLSLVISYVSVKLFFVCRDSGRYPQNF
jgi:uncharacterized protein with PQ loop repeat